MLPEASADNRVIPFENLLLFEVQDAVGIITVNRPKALNAINLRTVEELGRLLERVENDDGVRALVLTGAGEKAFIAGADIAELASFTPQQARVFCEHGHRVLFRLEQFVKPVIACVNGFALGGGCEIAMCCDFIYASERARFGQPEVNLGLVPGFGGTQRLARLVGKAKAKELCMTGEVIDAETARQLGLVAKVFPAEQLMDETMKVARALAAGPASLAAIRRVIEQGAELDLARGCVLEAEAFALNYTNADTAEGMAAFLAKRKPAFKGR